MSRGLWLFGTTAVRQVCSNPSGHYQLRRFLVLNQDASASFDYIVRLNTEPVSASLKVNIPVGLGAQTSGTIANQSTILLVFDAAGTLKRKIEYKRNPGGTPTLSDVPYP
jgi:hypothetical protein